MKIVSTLLLLLLTSTGTVSASSLKHRDAVRDVAWNEKRATLLDAKTGKLAAFPQKKRQVRTATSSTSNVNHKNQNQFLHEEEQLLLQRDLTSNYLDNNAIVDLDPLISTRHNDPIPKRNANGSYPTTATTQLMLSPCRPDANGYFGSTSSSSSSSSLEYTFELALEASKLPKESQMLRHVQDMVMDAVLSHVFPTVCAFQVPTQSQNPNSPASQTFQFKMGYDVTGFYFGNDRLDMVIDDLSADETMTTVAPEKINEQCQSRTDEDLERLFNNNQDNVEEVCHVYSSQVTIFGHDTEQAIPTISQVIFQALESAIFRIEPLGATRITSKGAVILVNQGNDGDSADMGHFSLTDTSTWMSTPVLIGMTILVALMVAGIMAILCYMRLYAKQYYYSARQNGKWSDTSTVSTVIGSLLFFSPTGTHVGDRQSTSPTNNLHQAVNQKNKKQKRSPQQNQVHRTPQRSNHPSGLNLTSPAATTSPFGQARVIIEFAASYDSEDDNDDNQSMSSSLPSDYYERTALHYLDGDAHHVATPRNHGRSYYQSRRESRFQDEY